MQTSWWPWLRMNQSICRVTVTVLGATQLTSPGLEHLVATKNALVVITGNVAVAFGVVRYSPGRESTASLDVVTEQQADKRISQSRRLVNGQGVRETFRGFLSSGGRRRI
jgi:hypothetical protein